MRIKQYHNPNRPTVPMQMKLTWRDIVGRSTATAFDGAPNIRNFSSGRLALYALLQSLRAVSSRREVLLPAYHCCSIVDPCTWSDLNVRFYNISADLRPDETDLAQKLSSNTLAVLFIHYFGFPAPISAAARKCREYGAAVIEDGCHINLVDGTTATSIGRFGDWVIGSMRKFYPVYDGGCVYWARGPSEEPLLEQPRTTFWEELRSLKHIVDMVLGSAGTIAPQLAKIGSDATTVLNNSGPDSHQFIDHRFTPTRAMGMTWASRSLLRRLNASNSYLRRREIYQAVLTCCRGFSRCMPVFPDLPTNVTPYVFPMRLKFPAEDHGALRSRGIQLYRWENLRLSNCPVSANLEQDLIQIPCHQYLTDEHVRLLLSSLNAVLS